MARIEINYPYRIICDESFIRWLALQPDKEILLSHLMHIKASSLKYRKHHNLILSSESKKVTHLKLDFLKGAFRINEDPEFLSIHESSIIKNIIFAINIAEDPPYNCYILTSPEILKGYLDNEHLKDIMSVKLASGETARKVIKNLFAMYTSKREVK